MNELIQQARELCEKAETDFWYVEGNTWHCGKPVVLRLIDALEAAEKELIDYHHTQQVAGGKTAENARLRRINEQLTARAEKAEAELDACKTDMRMHNDNLCETCKVENCEMRSNPPLSQITICFKHEWRGVKGN